MRDYIDLAEKNGVILIAEGNCQFCGANTQRGIHECVEIFSLGFQNVDYSNPNNHVYRFFIVDAHTLQHPEIHGRWNNHFHLSRLHLIFEYGVQWSYQLSPRLSDHLNRYKAKRQDEYLMPPKIGKRGSITTTDILNVSNGEEETKKMIKEWAMEVYAKWSDHHNTVDVIAKEFLEKI